MTKQRDSLFSYRFPFSDSRTPRSDDHAMQPSSRHDQCRVTASGSRETGRRPPTPSRSTPQFLRCVTGETFLTFRNENGLHLSDPLCIMNLTGNNIRHTKESMGSTPADRSGLTGKQSCGRRISCACCFPGSLRKADGSLVSSAFPIFSSVRCRRFGASRDCVPTLSKCK